MKHELGSRPYKLNFCQKPLPQDDALMNREQSSSKLQRLQELLVITLLGGLPTIMVGPKLRNIVYSTIFGRMGKAVYIQEGVEFLSTSCIEIGNGVFIFKGARLDARGTPKQ
jgi:galactoside O-acetyltransferase